MTLSFSLVWDGPIHNPQLDEAERLEEGTEYLILGEQFGPKEVQGLIYLVQALELQGRADAALARLLVA